MTPDPLNNEVPSRPQVRRRARGVVVAGAIALLAIASVGTAALTQGTARALTPGQLGSPPPPPPSPTPPGLAAASSATFTVGHRGTVSVTATGTPIPAVTVESALPPGVTLVDGGGGSATLSGTPQPGSGGVYDVQLTASNGVSPNATRTLTLTVDEAPVFDSSSSAAFTVSQAESMIVLATGFPIPTITKTGSLPAGLSFATDSEGAIISGTPAQGSEGVDRLTIVATNGVSPNASQAFTLTVRAAGTTARGNQFTVNDVSVGPRGAVTFELTVPGSGKVTALVTGRGVKHQVRRRLSPKQAGSTRVRMRVAVNRKHRSITLSVTYKPNDGTGRTVRIKGLRVP